MQAGNAGVQVTADVRQPHVHDRVVQAHHEQAHAADGEHQAAAPAARGGLGNRRARLRGRQGGPEGRRGGPGGRSGRRERPRARGPARIGGRGGAAGGKLEAQDGCGHPFW